jgi:hypothetical protein
MNYEQIIPNTACMMFYEISPIELLPTVSLNIKNAD